MKNFICIAIVLSALSVAKAQDARPYHYKLDGPFTTTQTIRVMGVCILCKHTIEHAVKKLPGVYLADWDVDSKLLLVKYNRLNITPEKIEQLVAETGHNTQHVKANAKAYNALPDCCKYEGARNKHTNL